jgi:coenzyme F420-0:L-glutamate ligase/coenzyme F420-1:gamma-L-glutamate ligase
VNVEILPVRGVPDVHPGDDLAALLTEALGEVGVRDGDIVAVTQKVVSKAEGRVVPESTLGRSEWVERESVRVLARRGDLVISQTRHGFVCANAGVDASNVEAGLLTLLPEDPDASAERLRKELADRLGVAVGVVVTDTFGRAWRRGLVNVSIGCAGLPALVDLRGTMDHTGRELEATVVALADEVAAASGLVMGKAARIPVAIVRGVVADGPFGSARELVRPPEEDLFRESPLRSVSARPTVRAFGAGEVPTEVLEEAIRAAAAAPGLGPASLLVVVPTSTSARRRLAAALADGLVAKAPTLLVPFVRTDEAAERDMVVAAGGAAVENLLLALHAQGFASAWEGGHGEDLRAALDVEEPWTALGVVVAGPPPPDAPPGRDPIDVHPILRER